MGGDNEPRQKSWQYVIITSQNRPGLPDFSRVTLKNMGRPGDEARNISIGDIVVLHADGMVPTKWPLGRVVQTFSGKDGLVRVANVKIQRGVFKRPIHKLALFLPAENWSIVIVSFVRTGLLVNSC